MAHKKDDDEYYIKDDYVDVTKLPQCTMTDEEYEEHRRKVRERVAREVAEREAKEAAEKADKK